MWKQWINQTTCSTIFTKNAILILLQTKCVYGESLSQKEHMVVNLPWIIILYYSISMTKYDMVWILLIKNIYIFKNQTCRVGITWGNSAKYHKHTLYELKQTSDPLMQLMHDLKTNISIFLISVTNWQYCSFICHILHHKKSLAFRNVIGVLIANRYLQSNQSSSKISTWLWRIKTVEYYGYGV